MRHPEWLEQLFLILCVMEIIKTHGEILSRETIFQLQKHPAANRDNGDGNKNTCYENHGTHCVNGEETSIIGKENDTDTAKLLNVFKNIFQLIEKSQCKRDEKNQLQKRKRRKIYFEGQQRENERYEDQEALSILQQLRLDGQKEQWQQQEQEQQQQEQQEHEQLKLQQQQNPFKLQHFMMHHLGSENFAKADKKKKKKKKRKKKRRKEKDKNKNKKPIKHETTLLAQPAHILFASPTRKPLLHFYHQHNDHQGTATATTQKPYLQHPLTPLNKIKYILRKNTIFKKKKKEYLNHLKHVLYPFIKFIAFFTIINPFTLAIFLFSLISPVVFGFLGFAGLSLFIKPALSLLFGVQHTVNAINYRKLQELRKRRRLRNSLRPITIHKHYYQQIPIKPLPATQHHHPPAFGLKRIRPLPHFRPFGYRNHHTGQIKFVNPLLPNVRQKLKRDKQFLVADIKEYSDSFERAQEHAL